ncbi:MAG: hypothetical protein ACK4G2_10795 [Novosphingobium sp.]
MDRTTTMLRSAIALLLMTSSGALSATPPEARDLPPAKQDEGEMICKYFKVTGSRLSTRRVCKTQKEWDDERVANGEIIRQQRGAAGGPQPGNSGG